MRKLAKSLNANNLKLIKPLKFDCKLRFLRLISEQNICHSEKFVNDKTSTSVENDRNKFTNENVRLIKWENLLFYFSICIRKRTSNFKCSVENTKQSKRHRVPLMTVKMSVKNKHFFSHRELMDVSTRKCLIICNIIVYILNDHSLAITLNHVFTAKIFSRPHSQIKLVTKHVANEKFISFNLSLSASEQKPSS